MKAKTRKTVEMYPTIKQITTILQLRGKEPLVDTTKEKSYFNNSSQQCHETSTNILQCIVIVFVMHT
jgi:hypothetical protein